MGRIFFVIGLFFFFLAGIGSSLIPNPEAWGLLCVCLGLLLGMSWPDWANWRRTPPS